MLPFHRRRRWKKVPKPASATRREYVTVIAAAAACWPTCWLTVAWHEGNQRGVVLRASSELRFGDQPLKTSVVTELKGQRGKPSSSDGLICGPHLIWLEKDTLKCDAIRISRLWERWYAQTYLKKTKMAIMLSAVQDVRWQRSGIMLEKAKQERKSERGPPTPPVTWCVNLFLQQSCIVRPAPVNLSKSEGSREPTLPQIGWLRV